MVVVFVQRITEDFNIYDLVQDMRTQRPSVVQTKVTSHTPVTCMFTYVFVAVVRPH